MQEHLTLLIDSLLLLKIHTLPCPWFSWYYFPISFLPHLWFPFFSFTLPFSSHSQMASPYIWFKKEKYWEENIFIFLSLYHYLVLSLLNIDDLSLFFFIKVQSPLLLWPSQGFRCCNYSFFSTPSIAPWIILLLVVRYLMFII